MKFSCTAVAAGVLATGAQAFMAGTSPVAFTKQGSSKTQLAAIEALGDDATMAAVAGGIVAALGGAAAFSMGGNESGETKEVVVEPEPEPIDVSIPYDAAARLAYDGWRAEFEKGAFDAAEFEKFKEIYEEATVMEVSMKKMSRDMEAKMGQMEGKITSLKKEMASMAEA